MKIALVIPSLGVGGAERVLVNMANYWAEQGEEVHIISLDSPDAPTFHVLNPRVHLASLNLLASSTSAGQALRQVVGRVQAIRRTLHAMRPDLAISFMDRTNVLTLLAARRLGIPIIVSDRVDPATPDIGRVWNALRSLSYRQASMLVVQAVRFTPFYGERMQGRIAVIPNPIGKHVRSRAPGSLEGRDRVVLAMARLVSYKKLDTVINAFASLAATHPDWDLHVYGQGPDRSALDSLINRLELGQRIKMMGVTDDALGAMSKASIYASASVAEGIPNVLIEAMAMGCAVVTSDTGGVPEVMTDGQDGLIVPMHDESALSQAMARLMSDSDLRRTFGNNAVKVRERFSEDRIMKMWDDLARSTVKDFNAKRR